MNPSKVPLEIIEKCLQKKTENGQSAIDLLISADAFFFPFSPSDFKEIDSPVTDVYRIIEALNEYFIKNDYPFEAHFDYNEAYIKKKRPLVCYYHNNLKLKTESDLKEHLKCPCPPIGTIPQDEREHKPIENEDRATIEKLRKGIEEERNVKKGILT